MCVESVIVSVVLKVSVVEISIDSAVYKFCCDRKALKILDRIFGALYRS